MDNRVFNINGRTKKQLALAVELLLLREWDDYQKVRGWYVTKEKGLVLTWNLDYNNVKPFTDRMGNNYDISHLELVDILWDWLSSEEANTIDMLGWDHDADHDGDNEKGWRLYTEDWGHVGSDSYAIGAFKPAYIWYGK